MLARLCFPLVLFVALVVTAVGCGPREKAEPVVAREALSLNSERPAGSGTSPVLSPKFLNEEELALKLEAPVRVAVPRPDVPPIAEPIAVDEAEPNEEAASAQQVFLPGTVRGTVGPGEGAVDHDWFRLDVDLEHPRVLQLDLSPAGNLDLSLELFREGLKGRELLVLLNNGGKGRGETLPNFRLVNGNYLLHVYPVGKKVVVDKPTPYTLTLVLEDARAGVETEPNDDHMKAEMLPLPGSVTGLVQRTEDQDWFQVDLLRLTPGTSRLTLELLPPVGANLVLAVFTQTREELLAVETGKGKKLVLPNVAILDGSPSYYLRVSAAEGSKAVSGEYSLKAAVESLKERTEVEPDGTAEQAMRLYLDEALSGWLAFEGDEDWFRIEPPDLSMLGATDSEEAGDAPEHAAAEAGAAPGLPGDPAEASGSPRAGDPAAASGSPRAGDPAVAGGSPGAGDPAEAGAHDVEHPAFRVQLSGVQGIDSVLELFEEDGQTPLGRYDVGSKGDGELIPNMALPTHPVLVRLTGKGHNFGVTYTLQSSLVPTRGLEVEPNNRPEEATLLAGTSRQMKGYLALVGDVDCVRLLTPVSRLSVTPPREVDVTVSFYDGPDRLVEQIQGRAGEPIRPQRAGTNATLLCLQLAGGAERGAAEPWILVVDLETSP